MKTAINSGKLFACALVSAFILMTVPEASAGERKLSFAVSGVVASVKVQAGQTVQKGSVLAVLDQTLFMAHKQAADAAAASAKLIHDLAEVKVGQVRDLFDALSTSQEEVDKAETLYAQSRSDYEAARYKAELASWELRHSTLRARFAGTVSGVRGYPGLVVNPVAGNLTVVVINAR